MANIAISAENVTFTLNGTVITDFLEGDFITLTPVNELTTQTNGANGSVNINKRIDGDVFDCSFRVIRKSDSDKFMLTEINQDTPTVFSGSLKEPFVADDSDFIENWQMEGGSITTLPTFTSNNQDGNHEVEYTIRFRSCVRII